MGDGFGWTGERWHNGIDFSIKGRGRRRSGPGHGRLRGWNSAGYGNLVVVRQWLGYETRYAHLSRVAAVPGTVVAGGSLLGYVGSTGYSTGPHLHFEVRRFGTPVDPMPRLLDAVSLSARERYLRAHKGLRRRRCRPNADARGGCNVDPARGETQPLPLDARLGSRTVSRGGATVRRSRVSSETRARPRAWPPRLLRPRPPGRRRG